MTTEWGGPSRASTAGNAQSAAVRDCQVALSSLWEGGGWAVWQVEGGVHGAGQRQGHCAAVAQPVQAPYTSMQVSWLFWAKRVMQGTTRHECCKDGHGELMASGHGRAAPDFAESLLLNYHKQNFSKKEWSTEHLIEWSTLFITACMQAEACCVLSNKECADPWLSNYNKL